MRAAIYARQSLDRSGESLAVSRQLAECRELAERNGWTDAVEYVDNDTSATNRKPRPRWSDLLTDLDAGRFDVLVCWHTDRLYRRVRDLVDLVEIAERRALRIASVKAADLDLSTPAGRMLAGMLGHAARYEIEQKSARQVAANRQRAQGGVVGWTRRPYGYERLDGRIVVVEEEAEVLRRAATAVLAGATLTSVCRDLNERGVPTSIGGGWTVTALKRLLVSPRQGGRATWRGEDFGRGAWAPVFDPETHDRLVATLNDPGRRTAPSTRVKYLLSGLLACGLCGGRMFAAPSQNRNGRRWMTYKCRCARVTRRLDLVDEVVEGVLLGRLARPDAADLFTPDADLDGVRSKVTELRQRRDGLAVLLADGLLTATAVRTQATRLSTQISDLERQIMSAADDGPLATVVSAEDVRATWTDLPLMAKREIIRTLLEVTILPAGQGVRFDPAQVQLDWRS